MRAWFRRKGSSSPFEKPPGPEASWTISSMAYDARWPPQEPQPQPQQIAETHLGSSLDNLSFLPVYEDIERLVDVVLQIPRSPVPVPLWSTPACCLTSPGSDTDVNSITNPMAAMQIYSIPYPHPPTFRATTRLRRMKPLDIRHSMAWKEFRQDNYLPFGTRCSKRRLPTHRRCQ